MMAGRGDPSPTTSPLPDGRRRDRVLVVGYGSDLRGDDAAGRRAADRLRARRLPEVRVLSLPQLSPELAADLAEVGLAIFIDASVDDDAVAVRPVTAAPPSWRLMHHVTPSSLLGLVVALGGTAPDAVVVRIPAVDLDLGLALSPTAAGAVDEAVTWVVDRCERHRRRAGPPAGPRAT